MAKTKVKERGDASLFDDGKTIEATATVVKDAKPAKRHAAPKVEPEPAKPKKGREIATRQAAPPASVPASGTDATLAITTLLRDLATNKDVDPDKLDKMIALQERMLDRQNKAAFDRELAIIQGKLPVIDRKGRIVIREKDGSGKRTGGVQQDTPYALYEDIIEAVTPILCEHGFSLRFETGITEQGLVKVVGILAGCGHRETAEFRLQHDSTGSKNSAQAVASSTTYGKRMATCAMLNIVSRGIDDDGRASGPPLIVGEPLSMDDCTKIKLLAEAAGCKLDSLLRHLNETRPQGHTEAESIPDLPASRYDEVVAAIRSYEANRREREGKKQAEKV